jgi:hypothetical protein
MGGVTVRHRSLGLGNPREFLSSYLPLSILPLEGEGEASCALFAKLIAADYFGGFITNPFGRANVTNGAFFSGGGNDGLAG